jgi:DNA polymerase V
MAIPYFKAKPLIEKYGVETFSSNYNLYGDMSWRVMETLRTIMSKQNVEVYSVDEAFINMQAVAANELNHTAMTLRLNV